MGTNIMLYISSSPHVLKDWIAIPNPRVNLVYKHCIRLKIYLVVKQLLYHSVSCYLLLIGLSHSLPKAAFTLSGKSELYCHKPASNIFDAVRYRRFVAIKLTFAAKCKRGLTHIT